MKRVLVGGDVKHIFQSVGTCYVVVYFTLNVYN